jgi:hypothetical protein
MALVGFAILISGVISGSFAAAGTGGDAHIRPAGDDPGPVLGRWRSPGRMGAGGRGWNLRAHASLARTAAGHASRWRRARLHRSRRSRRARGRSVDNRSSQPRRPRCRREPSPTLPRCAASTDGTDGTDRSPGFARRRARLAPIPPGRSPAMRFSPAGWKRRSSTISMSPAGSRARGRRERRSRQPSASRSSMSAHDRFGFATASGAPRGWPSPSTSPSEQAFNARSGSCSERCRFCAPTPWAPAGRS